jgi:hypothetical protein
MGGEMGELSPSDQVSADRVKAIIRSVLLECGVGFTAIDLTSSRSGWKAVIHDHSGMIFRLPIHAGPPCMVHQEVLEAIEAEW